MKPRTLGVVILALLAAVIIDAVDVHATEVQATLMVLLPATFLLGLLHPRRAWLWALIIGLSIPLTYLLAGPLGIVTAEPPSPPYTGLIVLVPAFIGTYAGVLAAAAIHTLWTTPPPAAGR